ncbi:MAG: hypothetical protein ACX94A_03840, partial [Algiphilus sp.]
NERSNEEGIQALIREPTPGHLLDALEQSWRQETPYSRLGVLAEYVSKALSAWSRDPQDDLAERLMALLSAVEPRAAQFAGPTESARLSGEALKHVEDFRALDEAREGAGPEASAVSWYPYGKVMREQFTFRNAPEIAEVWQIVDRLLPRFLAEQPERTPFRNKVAVDHLTLAGYDEFLSRMIEVASRSETEERFMRWLWNNRELDSGDLEEESLTAVPLAEAAILGQPALDALVNALANKDPNAQGWPLGLIDCLVLFTRLTVREIGAPLDPRLESPAFRNMFEELEAKGLLSGSSSEGNDDKKAQSGNTDRRLPGIGSADISMSSIIDLLPDEDFQPWAMATVIFAEMLVNDSDRVIRSRDGDLRMPWSRGEIDVLRLRLRSVTLMDGEPVESSLYRKHWWAPLMLNNLLHVRMGAAMGLLPNVKSSHRDVEHPAVVTGIALGMADEGWPLLANATLAYHLIAFGLSKEMVSDRKRWTNAIQALDGVPGSHLVRTALRMLSKVGVDETTREWAAQFVTSNVDLRLMEGPENHTDVVDEATMQMPWRKEAELEIAQCLGDSGAALLDALHGKARDVLVDHWLQWKDAAPSLGSGRYKAYPELVAGLFRVFEVQLREGLAPVWLGDSGESVRAWLRKKGLTVGDHFDASHFMILLRDPGSLPAPTRSALEEAACDSARLGRALKHPVFEQLRSARNNAAHEHSASGWKVAKLREQVLEGGVLKSFAEAFACD